MLTDSIRTEAYRDFILSNAPTHFAGKCVLDVGCGSGILSLFAAEAGAATVYGVEASTEIYAASLETVRASKMENRITLIRDRAETVKLPVDKVDVVLSEWMGYFLLFESMLDSVLHVARRYLCPHTGRIYPRHYTLNLLAVSCSPTLRHDNVDLWQNVYGYPMPALRRAALSEAHVLSLSDVQQGGGDQRTNIVVLTHVPCTIYNLDLYTLWQKGLHDSDFQPLRNFGECPFSLLVDAKPDCAPMVLDAFVGYFDVRFDDDASVQVAFSTSPMAPPTHWKHTVFFLDQPLKVEHGDRVTGSLTVRRSVRDTRGLEFSLRVDPLRDQPVVYQSYLLDFSAFLNPEFDHKHWINEALKSAVLEHNVEQKASELVLQLQAQMKDVMQTVDRTCLDAMHSIPRVIREVEALKVDAIALGSELDTMRESVSRVDPDSQQTISHLAELDRTRRNAQAAANALRETERWSTLVHAIDELMSAGEVDQVCCNIEGMEQCLSSLTHLPDYAARVALVAQHKNSLESLIAPQLIRALEHTVPTESVADTETDMIYAKREARHLIDLFRRIGRLDAAVNYYTNWLKTQLKACWERCTQTNAFAHSPYILQTIEQLSVTETRREASSFILSLEASSEDSESQRTRLLTFYAHLLQHFDSHLSAHIFADTHPLITVESFSEALKTLFDVQKSFILGASGSAASSNQVHRIDLVGRLLRLALICCSHFGELLRSHFPALLAKWTVAMERSVEQLVSLDSRSGYSQASGFVSALQVASLTGELSLQADAFVEAILNRSTDYFSKILIGQYLLALPEHLEPYMSVGLGYPEPERLKFTDMNLTSDQCSSRGLAECLHLGDVDVAAMSIAGSKCVISNEDSEARSSSQRRRLTSLNLGSRKLASPTEKPIGLDENAAAFCWLDSFISGAACDLLVNSLLRIGGVSSAPVKTVLGTSRSSKSNGEAHESGSDMEDQQVLTEHGAKQLEADLSYLQNLLEDLGLSFPGTLKALRELINCPSDQFANLSADRPPRIVNAVARLRGF
ncbi:hypothetical protein PHET_06446 [Paragonimus heterotremus]|uniref:Uncharacterized protein n=1 Tax=Paragonimus heterotremus TaxID=100268 RepID=A0A8J4SYA9_9TREM|nr:hypothetical protein PHET_06446 [Paragonimus heterotremus]